jgi:hypothetical protein
MRLGTIYSDQSFHGKQDATALYFALAVCGINCGEPVDDQITLIQLDQVARLDLLAEAGIENGDADVRKEQLPEPLYGLFHGLHVIEDPHGNISVHVIFRDSAEQPVMHTFYGLAVFAKSFLQFFSVFSVGTASPLGYGKFLVDLSGGRR